MSFPVSDLELVELDLTDFCGPVDAADCSVLERCVGPVIDLGCGPGRLTTALLVRRVESLGVDVAHAAVRFGLRQGISVIRRDLFLRLPGEGRWETVLLVDGNIGIGGDPERLLRRCSALIAATGQVIVETDPDPAADVSCRLQLADLDGRAIGEQPWSRVGSDVVIRYARRVGLAVRESWSEHERHFVTLARI